MDLSLLLLEELSQWWRPGGFTSVVSLVAEHSVVHRLQQLWLTSLVILSMWDFSWTRDQPCLLHWQADSQALEYQGSLRDFT